MEVESRCPPVDLLWGYLRDRLGQADDAALTDHVKSCRKCQASLSTFVPVRPARPADTPSCSVPPELTVRLRRLWAARPASTPTGGPDGWPAIPGFEIAGELGRGGMGVVYRARQPDLDREVAIKMLLPGRLTAADGRRLLNDAATASRLQHPHVVPIYAVGEHQGLPYFAMELISGGSLAQRVQDAVGEPRQAARLVAQVARALALAHREGVCHRDVKPANVMLRVRHADGDPARRLPPGGRPPLSAVDACLADFGLAKRSRGEPGLTLDGTVLGTPGYMAPEQVRSESPLPASDVYGLGAVLFECLTRQPPFRGATPFDTLLLTLHAEAPRPRALNSRLPRDLETICLKALEKEPSRRYTTASALADDLDRWLRGEPVLARPVGPIGRGWRLCRRKPLPSALAAALVLSLTTGLGASIWLWRQAAANETQAQDSLTNELAARREADEHYAMLRATMRNTIHSISSTRYTTFENYLNRLPLLQEAESTLIRLLERPPADGQLRLMLARLSSLLGTIYFLQGRNAESVAAFERAVAGWEQVPAAEVDQLEHWIWQSIAYVCLEQGYDRQGRRAEADRCFEMALQTWRALIRRDPTLENEDYLFPAAVNPQWLLAPNQVIEPEPSTRFRAVRERLDRLAAPDEAAFFYALLRLSYLMPKADLFMQVGHADGLRALALEAAAMLKRDLSRPGLDLAYRVCLANHAIKACGWLRRANQNTDALPIAVLAEQAFAEAAAAAPDDPLPFLRRSLLSHLVGKIHWDLGHPEETLTAMRRAVEGQRRAVELKPADGEARSLLGSRHMQLGRKYCELGRLDEAEACFAARQALWPGDPTRHSEALKELQKWAAGVGHSAAAALERQRYLELCSRLERRGGVDFTPRSASTR